MGSLLVLVAAAPLGRPNEADHLVPTDLRELRRVHEADAGGLEALRHRLRLGEGNFPHRLQSPALPEELLSTIVLVHDEVIVADMTQDRGEQHHLLTNIGLATAGGLEHSSASSLPPVKGASH